MYSWWWVQRAPETCRVILQWNKIETANCYISLDTQTIDSWCTEPMNVKFSATHFDPTGLSTEWLLKHTGRNFTSLWPCIVKVRWRENQQDANNLMFVLKYLSQLVSGIIMPIFRTRLCTTAYGVLHCNNKRWRAVSCSTFILYFYTLCGWGNCGGAVGWDTGRSRVQFPMVSLKFFIDIILQGALWTLGWLSL
jgi:hypothetical protein